jgi:hypothetical protein
MKIAALLALIGKAIRSLKKLGGAPSPKVRAALIALRDLIDAYLNIHK